MSKKNWNQYHQFTNSRAPYRKSLVWNLRLAISLLLILFIIIQTLIDKTWKAEKWAFPIFFITNITFSSMVLSSRFKKFLDLYLSVELLILCVFAVEFSISDSFSPHHNVFTGIQVGLMYTFLLVSKLPIGYLIFCVSTSFLHIIFRLFSSNLEFQITTIFVFFCLFVLLFYVFISKEWFDFKMWNNLESSHRKLLLFKNTIQVFPSEIVIVDQSSWRESTTLYVNEAVNKEIFIIKGNYLGLLFFRWGKIALAKVINIYFRTSI